MPWDSLMPGLTYTAFAGANPIWASLPQRRRPHAAGWDLGAESRELSGGLVG